MLGKLSVVGPSGVSCIIVSNGFANTGNSAKSKLKFANSPSNSWPSSLNIGPPVSSNRNVSDLVTECLKHIDFNCDYSQSSAPLVKEANLLHLNSDLASAVLEWNSQWNFSTTIERTISWYVKHNSGIDAFSCCMDDITLYLNFHQ